MAGQSLRRQALALTLFTAEVGPRVALRDERPLLAVGAPDRRADPGRVGGTDDGRAGAVAEDERRAAVVVVGEVGELLHPDDEDVLGAPAAHHVVGDRDAVAVAGAGGRDIERCARRPQPVREDRRCCRRLIGVGDRRHDDGAELRGVDAGRRERVAGRGLGHVDDALVGGGDPTLTDARALADPLVGGVDPRHELAVGHDALGPVAAHAPDAGVPGPGAGDEPAGALRPRRRARGGEGREGGVGHVRPPQGWGRRPRRAGPGRRRGRQES